MLNLLDQVISKVLDDGWTKVPPPAKPGFFFTVPDSDWQQKVKQVIGNRINIYLYEVRENRELHRAEWDVIEQPDRTTVLSKPPAYFDCHYLISAWSSTEDTEALTPVLDEHEVLAEALRVLMRNPDVVPGVLGIAGGGPVFQQAHAYLTVAPPETPRVLNDFWSTMKLPWRPAIQLIATAPLDLMQDTPPSPVVITFVQRYGAIGAMPNTFEELVQIGGWVLRSANGAPIADAIVLRLANGEEVHTDTQGRFTFVGLRPGIHRLRASAPNLNPIERDLDVPNGPPDSHIFRLS